MLLHHIYSALCSLFSSKFLFLAISTLVCIIYLLPKISELIISKIVSRFLPCDVVIQKIGFLSVRGVSINFFNGEVLFMDCVKLGTCLLDNSVSSFITIIIDNVAFHGTHKGFYTLAKAIHMKNVRSINGVVYRTVGKMRLARFCMRFLHFFSIVIANVRVGLWPSNELANEHLLRHFRIESINPSDRRCRKPDISKKYFCNASEDTSCVTYCSWATDTNLAAIFVFSSISLSFYFERRNRIHLAVSSKHLCGKLFSTSFHDISVIPMDDSPPVVAVNNEYGVLLAHLGVRPIADLVLTETLENPLSASCKSQIDVTDQKWCVDSVCLRLQHLRAVVIEEVLDILRHSLNSDEFERFLNSPSWFTRQDQMESRKITPPMHPNLHTPTDNSRPLCELHRKKFEKPHSSVHYCLILEPKAFGDRNMTNIPPQIAMQLNTAVELRLLRTQYHKSLRLTLGYARISTDSLCSSPYLTSNVQQSGACMASCVHSSPVHSPPSLHGTNENWGTELQIGPYRMSYFELVNLDLCTGRCSIRKQPVATLQLERLFLSLRTSAHSSKLVSAIYPLRSVYIYDVEESLFLIELVQIVVLTCRWLHWQRVGRRYARSQRSSVRRSAKQSFKLLPEPALFTPQPRMKANEFLGRQLTIGITLHQSSQQMLHDHLLPSLFLMFLPDPSKDIHLQLLMGNLSLKMEREPTGDKNDVNNGSTHSLRDYRSKLFLSGFHIDLMQSLPPQFDISNQKGIDQLGYCPKANEHYWGQMISIYRLDAQTSNQELAFKLYGLQFEWPSSSIIDILECLSQPKSLFESQSQSSDSTSESLWIDWLNLETVTGQVEHISVFWVSQNGAFIASAVESLRLSSSTDSALNTLPLMNQTASALSGLCTRLHLKSLTAAYNVRDQSSSFLFTSQTADRRQRSLVWLPHVHCELIMTDKLLNLNISEPGNLLWTPAVHLCALDAMDAINRVTTLFRRNHVLPEGDVVRAAERRTWTVWIHAPSLVQLSFGLTTPNHKMDVCLRNAEFRFATHRTEEYAAPYKRIKLSCDKAFARCDGQNIVFTKNAVLRLRPPSSAHRMDCSKFDGMTQTNRYWDFNSETFYITFPFRFLFRDIYIQFMSLVRYLRHLTSNPNELASNLDTGRSFAGTIKEPADHLRWDYLIQIKHFVVEVKDDPFEGRINDNYMVLQTEQERYEQRQSLLLQQCQSSGSNLTDNDLLACFARLEQQLATDYRTRLIEFRREFPPTDELFTWTMDNFRLASLADLSFCSARQILEKMRAFDPNSPWPNLKAEDFSTLWCRMIRLNVECWRFELRDYPKPWLEMRDLFLWGPLIGAGLRADWLGQRTVEVVPDPPWPPCLVTRHCWPTKFYYDFSADLKSIQLCYGPNWEPCVAWLSQRLEDIIPRPVDESTPRLGWWDKSRHLLHGRLYFATEVMHWFCSTSFNPYNMTEFFAWEWSRCAVCWETGHFRFEGDSDITYHTATKYDGVCKLLHLPNLELNVHLDWLSLRNQWDHHSVKPRNWARLTPEERLHHDTYRYFRGNRLAVKISFMIHPIPVQSALHPSCLFYTSVIKFADKLRTCLTRVARPIRRGLIFSYRPTPKPTLGRVLQQINFNFTLPQLEIAYWVSYANRTGVYVTTGPIQLAADMFQNIEYATRVPLERTTEPTYVMIPPWGRTEQNGFIRRPVASWSVRHLSATVRDSRIRLRRHPDLPGQVVQMLLKHRDGSRFDEGTVTSGKSSTDSTEDFIMVPLVRYEQVAPTVQTPQDLTVRVRIPGRRQNESKTSRCSSVSRSPTHFGSPGDQIEASVLDDQRTHESLTPTHHLQVTDLKFRWTERNRDLVYILIDTYQHTQSLKRNLSARVTKNLNGLFTTDSHPTRTWSGAGGLHRRFHPLGIPTVATSSNLFSHDRKADPSTTVAPVTSGALFYLQEKDSQTDLQVISGSSDPRMTNRAGPFASTNFSSLNASEDIPEAVSMNEIPMLAQLVEEVDTARFYAYCEEEPRQADVVEKLHGLAICASSPVISRNWNVELINSQLLLKTEEQSGYVLVTAARAKLDALSHPPIWKDAQLLDKSTLVGHLECMQYYATVGQIDPSQPVQWLSTADVSDWSQLSTTADQDTLSGRPEVVGSGHAVGGVVNAVNPSDPHQPTIQLQRMISRCSCQVFYVRYEPVDATNLPAPHLIPPLPSDKSEVVRTQEGADTVTLLHHTLNICTNSLQYHLIVSIVNDLLLHVEPNRKAQWERNRVALGLMSESQLRTAIQQDQETLRFLFADQRKLERELWALARDTMRSLGLDAPANTIDSAVGQYGRVLNTTSFEWSPGERMTKLSWCIPYACDLESRITNIKSQIVDRNTSLTQRLAHYQQLRIQSQRCHSHPMANSDNGLSSIGQSSGRPKSTLDSTLPTVPSAASGINRITTDSSSGLTDAAEFEKDPRHTKQPSWTDTRVDPPIAEIVRRSEVCFEHARWRMTENDGQIGLADVELRGFLYAKTHRQDNSGSHWLELGWIHVNSLAPNSFYKEVLVPDVTGGHYAGGPILRIACSESVPVGGLSVKEAMEISVAPIALQVSKQFYRVMMPFFFPEKPEELSTPNAVLDDNSLPASSFPNKNLDTMDFEVQSSMDTMPPVESSNLKLIEWTKRGRQLPAHFMNRPHSSQSSIQDVTAASDVLPRTSSPDPTTNKRRTNLNRPNLDLTGSSLLYSNTYSDLSSRALLYNIHRRQSAYLDHPPSWLHHSQPQPDQLSLSPGPLQPSSVVSTTNPVEVMRERARQNNVFLYIKIPGFPICLSYKGEKQKNLTDVTAFRLTVPTLEYHNCVWTWLDFAMEVKTRVRKQLIREVIKKKFTPRRRLPFARLKREATTSNSTRRISRTSSLVSSGTDQTDRQSSLTQEEERVRRDVELILGRHAQPQIPRQTKWRRLRHTHR